MSAQNARRVSTSIATVGSSRNRSSGSPAIARANRTRWASPPDRASRSPVREVREPGPPQRPRRAASGRRQAAGELDELADAGVDRQARFLEHRADPAAADGVARAPSEDRDGARLGPSRPSISPIAVDLPAPFGPRRATVSPAAIRRSMPARATVGPNVFVTPRNSTAAGAAERGPGGEVDAAARRAATGGATVGAVIGISCVRSVVRSQHRRGAARRPVTPVPNAS